MNRYRLLFDSGEPEVVEATGPTQAVAARQNERLPHTITDLTAMASFAGRRGYANLRPFAKEDDGEVARFDRAKELA